MEGKSVCKALTRVNLAIRMEQFCHEDDNDNDHTHNMCGCGEMSTSEFTDAFSDRNFSSSAMQNPTTVTEAP